MSSVHHEPHTEPLINHPLKSPKTSKKIDGVCHDISDLVKQTQHRESHSSHPLHSPKSPHKIKEWFNQPFFTPKKESPRDSVISPVCLSSHGSPTSDEGESIIKDSNNKLFPNKPRKRSYSCQDIPKLAEQTHKLHDRRVSHHGVFPTDLSQKTIKKRSSLSNFVQKTKEWVRNSFHLPTHGGEMSPTLPKASVNSPVTEEPKDTFEQMLKEKLGWSEIQQKIKESDSIPDLLANQKLEKEKKTVLEASFMEWAVLNKPSLALRYMQLVKSAANHVCDIKISKKQEAKALASFIKTCLDKSGTDDFSSMIGQILVKHAPNETLFETLWSDLKLWRGRQKLKLDITKGLNHYENDPTTLKTFYAFLNKKIEDEQNNLITSFKSSIENYKHTRYGIKKDLAMTYLFHEYKNSKTVACFSLWCMTNANMTSHFLDAHRIRFIDSNNLNDYMSELASNMVVGDNQTRALIRYFMCLYLESNRELSFFDWLIKNHLTEVKTVMGYFPKLNDYVIITKHLGVVDWALDNAPERVKEIVCLFEDPFNVFVLFTQNPDLERKIFNYIEKLIGYDTLNLTDKNKPFW